MNKVIVHKKGGYSFAEALDRAKEQPEYYEESLLVETAARIIDAMETQGVKRSELARRLKLSPAYITKVLRGHANLSLESLAKIAFALDLKWECILIPKHAKVSLLSLTNESGIHAIRAVETTTIEGMPIVPAADEYAQDEEEHYVPQRQRITA
jgi:transcriptional regulator with XRE-family HTH domain